MHLRRGDDGKDEVTPSPLHPFAAIVFEVRTDAVQHITGALRRVTQRLTVIWVLGDRLQINRRQFGQRGGIPVFVLRAKLFQGQRRPGQAQIGETAGLPADLTFSPL